MNVLVVGYGSIARRHIRNLRNLIPDAVITVWRHSPDASASGAGDPSDVDHIVYDQEDAIKSSPQIALITNPASYHISRAHTLAEQNVHLFIEKPFSSDLSGIEELIDLCNQKSLKLFVAYNFHFYRPLQEMKQAIQNGLIGRVLSARAEVGQYLPDWRPAIDYRNSVSANEKLGGGALLELSHDIDNLLWMVGDVDDVMASSRKISDLEIDVEDIAEIILGFKGGAMGSVHLDFLQRSPHRECKIIGSMGTLVWNATNHTVSHYSTDTRQWNNLYTGSPADYQDMYVREMQHFLNCVAGNTPCEVDGEKGRKTLEVVLAAKKSSETGCKIYLHKD